MLRRNTPAIGIVAEPDTPERAHPRARALAVEDKTEALGAELGGAQPYRTMTVVLFATLWLVYILLSALVAYGDVKGF
jgi:hypothetical protein